MASKEILAVAVVVLVIGGAAGYIFGTIAAPVKTTTTTSVSAITNTSVATSTLTSTTVFTSLSTIISTSTETTTRTVTGGTPGVYLDFPPSFRLSVIWNTTSISRYGAAILLNESVKNIGTASVSIPPLYVSSLLGVESPNGTALAGTTQPTGVTLANVTLGPGERVSQSYVIIFGHGLNDQSVSEGTAAHPVILIKIQGNGSYALTLYLLPPYWKGYRQLVTLPVTVNISQ